MTLLRFALILLLLNCIRCHNSESSELNEIDDSPFYDTIIFSDIADVLNEFENHVNSPIDAFINSESVSSEDIEELLSEYQHYLDKAQKHRNAYTDKAKPKNKVPLIRHEKYDKTKPGGVSANYNKYYFKGDYYKKQSFKFPETQYANPINLLTLNPKNNYLTKSEMTTVPPNGNHDNSIEKIINNEKKLLDLPKIIYKSTYEPKKSSCFCKKDRMPCDCKCKQCMLSLDSFPGQYTDHTKIYDDKKLLRNPFLSDTLFKDPVYVTEDKTTDNTLNLRIKIDFSLPKPTYGFEKYFKSFDRGNPIEKDVDRSKDYFTALNLPLSYFNFPIPMNMVGYNKLKKFSKHDLMPLHKITTQKKNKSKVNSNGKKHRKKLITFHNIKLEPQFFTTHFEGIYNTSVNDGKIGKSSMSNATDKLETVATTEKPYENQSFKENNTENTTIFLMVNITSNISNETVKNEKKDETENLNKVLSNLTTEKPTNNRIKREISSVSQTVINANSSILTGNLTVLPISMNITKSTREKTNFTNSDKVLITDTELLYWPSNNNRPYNSKNITAIILEKENKKAKLNVSKETLRRNHTQALEQAIFGEVNWNDVETIAPTFLSFVGKYIRGALTFCSDSVCHSMKCAEKKCVHRICSPENRINNKGHCAGSNNTDSIVSMESIMDLPSNIPFEIVDILQDKMLGKLYGKVTLCITAKCISFAASKKMFTKTKCSIKILNTTSHCPNTKNKKMM